MKNSLRDVRSQQEMEPAPLLCIIILTVNGSATNLYSVNMPGTRALHFYV